MSRLWFTARDCRYVHPSYRLFPTFVFFSLLRQELSVRNSLSLPGQVERTSWERLTKACNLCFRISSLCRYVNTVTIVFIHSFWTSGYAPFVLVYYFHQHSHLRLSLRRHLVRWVRSPFHPMIKSFFLKILASGCESGGEKGSNWVMFFRHNLNAL